MNDLWASHPYLKTARQRDVYRELVIVQYLRKYHGNRSLSEIAFEMPDECSKPVVKRNIDRLVAEGWVERVAIEQEGELTGLGRVYYRISKQVSEAEIEALVGQLSVSISEIYDDWLTGDV